MVFSVNNCCRPRMTTTKPMLYPILATSAFHSALGRWLASNPSMISEAPIESPAASPDQNNADDGRASSSIPSFRIALQTTTPLDELRRSASSFSRCFSWLFFITARRLKCRCRLNCSFQNMAYCKAPAHGEFVLFSDAIGNPGLKARNIIARAVASPMSVGPDGRIAKYSKPWNETLTLLLPAILRQYHREIRAVPVRARHADMAQVSFHHSFDETQAEP